MSKYRSRREHRRIERMAASLGVQLNPHHDGLGVNGHHGMKHAGDGCGSYDLVLIVAENRVDCAECGATDLVRTLKVTDE